ncbi:MAG: isochorismatase family protein [Candidatus Saccharibacteria bacterium]|nr:isochorismatase family protein [Candidatus Saccharibacteria bacterium]
MTTTTHEFAPPITIVVDEQNDFFPGGALGVAGGEEIIAPTNAVTEWTRRHDGQVIFTRDKHNPETKHFNTNGGPWPVHCVAYPDILARPQGAEGAALHPEMVIAPEDMIASKGMSNEDDGYSGAEAVIETNGEGQVVDAQAVTEYVQAAEARHRNIGKRTLLIVMGLATDYCVKATVLDLLEATDKEWAQIYVLTDAIRAVNLAYGDGEEAIRTMQEAGAVMTTSQELMRQLEA